MRTLLSSLVLLSCVTLVLTGPVAAQQKLAQTGMKFLMVESDPRAAALGGAYTAIEGASSMAFFNPAGTARLNANGEAFFGYTQWIADIKHYFGSVSYGPSGGDIGVFTISAQAVDYGEFEQTIRYDNTQGFLDLESFRPKGLALGLGYARALSEKFSIGANLKYITQNLGSAVVSVDPAGGYGTSENEVSVLAFDFGVLYKTGFKSLNIGMCVRNFGKEARYVDEGFQIPLTFRIGLSMDMMDLTEFDREMHSLLLIVDAEHPRDYGEMVKIGAEYLFMKRVALRVGYVFPSDEHGVSFGIGLRQPIGGVGLGVDYAFTPFGIFGNVQRVSLLIGF